MKKQIALCLLLFLLLLFSTICYGQQYEFSHLDNTNGLSNNQVECIYKDSRGFMWFGTNMGLNRYDGNNFKVYKHNKKDAKSPPSNRFTAIQEDADGNLWLELDTYYAFYDWHTESFTHCIDSLLAKMRMPQSVSIIRIDDEKNIFAYYPLNGIYKYNQTTKQALEVVSAQKMASADKSQVVEMKIRGQYIWMLHQNGLVEQFDTKTGKFAIRNTFFNENLKTSTIKKSLFIDSDGDLWLYPALEDKGIAYLDIKKNEWYFLDKDNKGALSSTFVRCVGQDKEGLLWIGTDHEGLNIFDKKSKKITVLKHNKYNLNSISQNSIISIFFEDNASVWVGTYKNGISYYHPNMFKFKKTPLYNTFSPMAETFDCNNFYKDNKANLWIGTNGQGLIRNDSETNKIEVFKNSPTNANSLSSDIITSIYEDHSHTLWIGTFMGGLNAYNGSTFKRYQIEANNANSLSGKSVYGIMEDNAHNLWIGTLGAGVNKLDGKRQQFTQYTHENTPALYSNFILSMFADTSHNVYLGTDRGINVVDYKSSSISPYWASDKLLDSLTSTVTNQLIVDRRNLLWLATNNGINIYNPTTKTFTYLTSQNGLQSEEVMSLVEDNNGNIWAGTRRGLICIYCKYVDGKLETNIAFFDQKDGLPGSVCNQKAAYKDNAGLIYIGTTTGYVCFDPLNIVFNSRVPKPKFTNLLIENQTIEPNVAYNGRIILQKSITDIDEIVLNHDETNFTIQFSALNFIHPEKNGYRYMLQGLDNKWITISNGEGAASYSNLNAGSYNLIVYAANDDNVWIETPIELKIVVKPPLWLSWWAFIIYIVIFGGVTRFFIKYKLDKQRSEYEQAQKILEANKIHEVDELKFKFFTNISHEFKTPLTLIITPLESLLKSPASDVQKQTLSIMYKNALNLLNMVNEILDFRKFDLNKMTINRSHGNIIAFTKDICQSFSSFAAEKSIKLTFTTYLEELQMEFDKEKMNKIVSNLISNAFKYTVDGQIDVSIGIMELMQSADANVRKQVSIKVSDTGVGIESAYIDKIFERFFRIENTERAGQSGTGVGLHLVSEYVKLHGGDIRVESTVGKGSAFTILLPVLDSTYKELSNQDIIHSGESQTEAIGLTAHDKEISSTQKANLPLLLIVDDNDDFCEFIKNLFIQDYRIVMANDGEEGYSIVLDQLPEIILCDVMMPKVDGYEFCRKVKGDIRTSHIPIILLTAKSSEENKYSGIEAGADDYISKPFNIDMLKLKIVKIIERQRKIHTNFKKKIDISPSEIAITSMDEKFVKKAIAIVEQNMGNTDFLVEDLCKEMGMSRVYFYKKILTLTDKSPSEFIRFIRLKRAAELLQKSQLFVNEIAYQVGFNDPKYFRKYFKEEFGVTPNEYKKKLSE